jgi:glycosyltransferase involved in cell wall biosynthesis
MEEMNGKRILIIFPYGNLAYSPTILNLCKLLRAAGHEIKVVFGFEEFWGEMPPSLSGVTLEKISYSRRTVRIAKHVNNVVWSPMARFLRKLGLFDPYSRLSVREILFSQIIKRALGTNAFDELIAVDILPLYWAQAFHHRCHFVSLEVDDGIQLLDTIDASKIKSVVIQSEARFRRLFPTAAVTHFLVQNAPTFVPPVKRTTASRKLIYNGTVWNPFGANDLFEFVKRFPEYTIHFKGTIHPLVWKTVQSRYRALVDSGSLSFSPTYLPDDELRTYLTDYSVGFCLYNFDDPLIAQRRFNYETAPSGKVFLYLAIGMPVVATRIPGFRFIEEDGSGILLDDHKPDTIRNAVDAILGDYTRFSDRALASGKRFSFDELARPFVNFISQ